MPSIIEKAIKSLAERQGKSEEEIKKILEKAQSPISPEGKDVGGKEIILAYDSVGEGLEPVYFWILDFMRNKPGGLGFEVSKTAEEFEASVGSAFYGDIGTRAGIMQDRAMKMIGMVNTVVRSIMNILYDLKEFEIRLELYRNLHSSNEQIKKDARLGLKQIWLDRVDMQRGRGAIHAMAQQLNFVTLRDAFLAAESEEDVEKMDLNERVKRILGPRLQEYLKWEKMSELELTRRYNIEKYYLKSQVDSLKLYAMWAKPYIIAAQKLRTAEFKSPDIISTFSSNIQLSASLFGKKEQKPDEERFKNIKLDKKIYACIEIEFDFRGIPHLVGQTREGARYAQGGRVDMHFRAFGLDEDHVKEVENQEIYEGLELVEGISTQTIKELQSEIDKYTKEEEDVGDPFKKLSFLQSIRNETTDSAMRKKIDEHIKELKKTTEKPTPLKETEKKELEKLEDEAKHRTLSLNEEKRLEQLRNKSKQIENPFSALFSVFKDLIPKKEKKTANKFVVEETFREAKETASKQAYIIYRIFKKAHNMFAE